MAPGRKKQLTKQQASDLAEQMRSSLVKALEACKELQERVAANADDHDSRKILRGLNVLKASINKSRAQELELRCLQRTLNLKK
jgi:hypothetical protein